MFHDAPQPITQSTMKTSLHLFCLLLLSGLAFAAESVKNPSAQAQTGIVQAANGKSLAPIILPKEATMFTKIAAKDLADYIGKVGGAKP